MILACSTCSSWLKTWAPSVSLPTSWLASRGTWSVRLALCLLRQLFGAFAAVSTLVMALLLPLLFTNAFCSTTSYGMAPTVPPPSKTYTSTTCPSTKTISSKTTRWPRSNASLLSSLGVSRLYHSLFGLCS
jgi:hypothetical protein